MRLKLSCYQENPRKRWTYWALRVFIIALLLYMGWFCLVAYQTGVEDTCRGIRSSGYTVR